MDLVMMVLMAAHFLHERVEEFLSLIAAQSHGCSSLLFG
jgi:hypothetical protein